MQANDMRGVIEFENGFFALMKIVFQASVNSIFNNEIERSICI